MFKGVYTALVTPFKNERVDFDSLEKLVKHQLDNGIQGFIVNGTTAENPTLTEEEKFSILDHVCKIVNKRVPIIFGSGTNSTASTIALSQKAAQYPIDGLLVVVPYYNKPPQAGLVAHFKAVAESTELPIILYNVPGRTIVSLSPESVVELAQVKNIVGIKEADSNLDHFAQYQAKVPQDFSLLSGDDESCVDFCLQGGHGVISVCSHVAPKQMVEWIDQACQGDGGVRHIFQKQQSWIASLYISANPIPVKFALHKKGLLETDDVRLPLVPLNRGHQESVTASLNEFDGLLTC